MSLNVCGNSLNNGCNTTDTDSSRGCTFDIQARNDMTACHKSVYLVISLSTHSGDDDMVTVSIHSGGDDMVKVSTHSGDDDMVTVSTQRW